MAPNHESNCPQFRDFHHRNGGEEKEEEPLRGWD